MCKPQHLIAPIISTCLRTLIMSKYIQPTPSLIALDILQACCARQTAVASDSRLKKAVCQPTWYFNSTAAVDINTTQTTATIKAAAWHHGQLVN